MPSCPSVSSSNWQLSLILCPWVVVFKPLYNSLQSDVLSSPSESGHFEDRDYDFLWSISDRELTPQRRQPLNSADGRSSPQSCTEHCLPRSFSTRGIYTGWPPGCVRSVSDTCLHRGLSLAPHRWQAPGCWVPSSDYILFWKDPSHPPRELANSRLSKIVFNNIVSPFKEQCSNPGTEFWKFTY